MTRDRRREPLLVHIDEPLREHALQVLDLEIHVGAVRHAELVRAAEELEGRKVVPLRLAACRTVQIVQRHLDPSEVALDHVPSLAEGIGGVAVRGPQFDAESKAVVLPSEPSE